MVSDIQYWSVSLLYPVLYHGVRHTVLECITAVSSSLPWCQTYSTGVYHCCTQFSTMVSDIQYWSVSLLYPVLYHGVRHTVLECITAVPSSLPWCQTYSTGVYHCCIQFSTMVFITAVPSSLPWCLSLLYPVLYHGVYHCCIQFSTMVFITAVSSSLPWCPTYSTCPMLNFKARLFCLDHMQDIKEQT